MTAIQCPGESGEAEAHSADRPGAGPRGVVIGAGPAGLTAAYLLSKQHSAVTVLEADPVVGGISRTVQFKGYRFDIGGHRLHRDLIVVGLILDNSMPTAMMAVWNIQGAAHDVWAVNTDFEQLEEPRVDRDPNQTLQSTLPGFVR